MTTKNRIAVTLALLLAAGSAQLARAEGDVTTIDGKFVIPADDFAMFSDDEDSLSVKGGIGVRSAGGQAATLLRSAVPTDSLPAPGVVISGTRSAGASGKKSVSTNVQINDPALDHIVTFPPAVGTRPFEFATQSETSTVSMGQDIVVGYNNSAGGVVEFFPGAGLFFTQLLFSGYSVSHDGGQTWVSNFVPSVSPDAPFTFGDPSLAADRNGNVYYASLGADANAASAIIINKSTDKGSTFGPATVVVLDDGGDKEWLAIGPDPKTPARDNLYITWTSFRNAGSELWFARSIDGGATWTTKALFAPVDNGSTSSSFVQFSSPTVDASTGRLYVPFVHFSDIDSDNIRVLVSDDGGDTFHFLAFNVAGAPDAFSFPNVQPGAINDCGTGGGFRNSLHQGPSTIAPSGFSRWVQSTRLIQQPSAAADRGRFVFALNTSTSPFFGDPTAGSTIRIVLSPDGGASWAAPITIPSTTADPQHVHPSLALGQNANRVWVGYYVQQANEQLRTDLATLHIDGNKLRLDQTTGLSTVAFDLTPSNITRTPPTTTTNFDRTVVACYDIGEYMSVAARVRGESSTDGVVAAWGDNRNTWTGPPGSAAPYTHAQPDVFFGRVGN
jgi:hypothetical protein